MAVPSPFFLTPEERFEAEVRWIKQHYLESNRRFTIDYGHHWESGYGMLNRIESRTAYIREADCPWRLRALKSYRYLPYLLPGSGLVARFLAWRWAKKYLKRGRPEDGYLGRQW